MAPVESVTVMSMRPVYTWAAAGVANASNDAHNTASRANRTLILTLLGQSTSNGCLQSRPGWDRACSDSAGHNSRGINVQNRHERTATEVERLYMQAFDRLKT
jgi:hypothetical protein